MAKVLFVVHPYNAPTNVKGTICRWNTTKSHWRKVIYSEGAHFIDLLDKAEYRFPYGYSHVTLSRLHPDDFVWDGEMYDVTEPGTSDMFSFVPCRPVSSLRHPAPIDVPCVISDTIWGSKLSVGRNAGPITVPDIKSSLTRWSKKSRQPVSV